MLALHTKKLLAMVFASLGAGSKLVFVGGCMLMHALSENQAPMDGPPTACMLRL